jgi:hypothetical protein
MKTHDHIHAMSVCVGLRQQFRQHVPGSLIRIRRIQGAYRAGMH